VPPETPEAWFWKTVTFEPASRRPTEQLGMPDELNLLSQLGLTNRRAFKEPTRQKESS
jgi:hypothetical protein